METIVKSKNGNYFLRSIPGYKQFKPYTKDEMIYYSISDSESLTNNSSDDSILYNTDEDLMEKNAVNDMMEEDIEKDIEEKTEGDIEKNEDMTDIEDPFFLKADSTIEINMEEVPAENHHSTNIMILLSN